MGTSSEWLGRFQAVDVLVRNELAAVGVDSEGIEAAQTALYAGDGQSFIREAVRKYALERQKARGIIVDLGDGWLFTVDETVELKVSYGVTVRNIEKRSSMSRDDWSYVAQMPKLGDRKVKAVIGRLNRNWTEEQVTDLLAKPGCLLKGSGAWVREGFLAARPNYDEKGSIAFPDKGTSRWRYVHGGDVCFPNLWYDGYERWCRSLSQVRYGWSASGRLCLLCE